MMSEFSKTFKEAGSYKTYTLSLKQKLIKNHGKKFINMSKSNSEIVLSSKVTLIFTSCKFNILLVKLVDKTGSYHCKPMLILCSNSTASF